MTPNQEFLLNVFIQFYLFIFRHELNNYFWTYSFERVFDMSTLVDIMCLENMKYVFDKCMTFLSIVWKLQMNLENGPELEC